MPGIEAPTSSCQTENQDSMGFMRIFVIEQLLHNSAPCTIYFIPLFKCLRSTFHTNYDSIIEDTLRRNDKIVDVIVEQVQYKNYTPGRDAVVYKMHGDKSNPDKAVITKTDYEVYDTYRTVFSKGLVMELMSGIYKC